MSACAVGSEHCSGERPPHLTHGIWKMCGQWIHMRAAMQEGWHPEWFGVGYWKECTQ